MAWSDASSVIAKLITEVPDDVRIRTLQAVIRSSRQNNFITISDLGDAGKKRQLRATYFAPNCEPASCETNICDGTAIEPAVLNLAIAECTSSNVYKISAEHMRLVDGNFGWDDYATTVLKQQMNEVRTNLNAAIAAKLVTYVGNFADGSASKQIPFVDPASGAINPRGYFEIERAIQDIGLNDPYIVGGKDVFVWERGIAMGGLNAQGQRIDAIQFGNAFYDNVLENAFADPSSGHILAYSARSIMFVPFVRNVGQFANKPPVTVEGFNRLSQMFRQGETYYRGVVIDPLTGLMYDLTIERDACSDSFNMRLSIEWDLFNFPQMLCNVEGVTGVFHFTTCLPVEIPCPSPANPNPQPSVMSATVDTDGDLPVLVEGFKIGSTTYAVSPAVTVNSATELAALMTSTIPAYSFFGNNTDETIGFMGYSGVSIEVVADPTSDNFTLTFA